MLKYCTSLIAVTFCLFGYSQTTKIIVKQFDYLNLPSKVAVYDSNSNEIYKTNQAIDSFFVKSNNDNAQKISLILDDNIKSPLDFFVFEKSFTIIIYQNNIDNIIFINSDLNSLYLQISKLINDLYEINKYSYREQLQNQNNDTNKIRNFEKMFYELIPNSYLSANYLYDECIMQNQDKNDLVSFFNLLNSDSLSQFNIYNTVDKMLKYQQCDLGMPFPSIELHSNNNKIDDINDLIDDNIIFIYLWDPLCPHCQKLNREIGIFISENPAFSKRIIAINKNIEIQDITFPWYYCNASEIKVIELIMKLWSHKVPDGFIIEKKKIIKMHVKFKDFLEYIK